MPIVRLLFIFIILIIFVVIKSGHDICIQPFSKNTSFVLPTFKNMDDLYKSQWYIYLTQLYDDEQLNNMMPIAMDSFWILFTDKLPESLYKTLKWSLTPHNYKALYSLQNHAFYEFVLNNPFELFSRPKELYIYQYTAVPHKRCNFNTYHIPHRYIQAPIQLDSYQSIEVIRTYDAPKSCIWFYYAKGSGIWINLGRTIAFQEHSDAFEYFGINKADFSIVGDNLNSEIELGEAIRKNGNYDSVQFTCCHEQIYKFEIMFVNDKQPNSKSPCINIPTWGRGNKLCKCDPNQRFINCN